MLLKSGMNIMPEKVTMTHCMARLIMMRLLHMLSKKNCQSCQLQKLLSLHIGIHMYKPRLMSNLGHSGVSDAIDDMGSSSSCSSPGDRSCDGDEVAHTLEIMDESETDGEVARRLNQMTALKHIPRINRDIPSVDEATSDHERLLNRLLQNGLVEHKVEGDGNCQFRALSDQFYRTPEHHKFVRQEVVNQLRSHPETYEGYVPMAYDEYLTRMSKSGEWGDHVTLQAAADSYGVKILVITSFKDTCYLEILPKIQKSKRVIHLSFWAEVHYNSIYPEGESPPRDVKKKKKNWWSFGNKH
ncbi:OVARIAN TUMOR DOMAIN-containing deubiquitinating enzyme 9-like isoform X2 [Ipomoea triloba]|uniref:OVARIAN TUMOR DOMAIN-containing deubiquitinating enzyme 9-like isoform X2 n=1 Tax=Ipomoea triloba TaxID=35885 RepID=UPI00125D74CA|nr:OVARIAN TUMOR DOMAIN-containing deubiquitinating enzyme 9-like isoform X2 [Ipomoea triloba]